MAFDFSGVATSAAGGGVEAALGAVAPELEIFVELFKELGKVLAELAPLLEPIVEPLKELTGAVLKSLGTLIETVVSALTPALTVLNTLIQAAATYLQVLALPLKAVSTAFELVASATKAALAPLTLFLSAVQTFASVVGGALSALTDPIGAITDMAGKVKQLSAAGAEFLSLPFNALSSGISNVQSQLNGFISKLNPAYLLYWNRSVDDLQASIGKTLLPVLDAFTKVVRDIGSTINGLSGSGQDFIRGAAGGIVVLKQLAITAGAAGTILTGGLAPAFAAMVGAAAGLATQTGPVQEVFRKISAVMGGTVEKVGQAVQTLVPAVTPLFNIFGKLASAAASLVQYWSGLVSSLGPQLEAIGASIESVFDSVMEAIKPFGELLIGGTGAALKGLAQIAAQAAPIIAELAVVVSQVFKAVGEAIQSLLSFLGISLNFPTTPQESQKKDNTGLAARSSSIGSVEDYLKQAYTKAIFAGGGTKDDLPKQQLSATLGIQQELSAFKNEVITAISNAPGHLADAIIRNLPSADSVARGAADVATGGLAGQIIDFGTAAKGQLEQGLNALSQTVGSIFG